MLKSSKRRDKTLEYKSVYVPMPADDLYKRRVRPAGFKAMRYFRPTLNRSVFEEFKKLHDANYTHVVDMPGNYKDIARVGADFGIVCLGTQLPKFVAEMCSRTLQDQNFNDMDEHFPPLVKTLDVEKIKK